MLKDSPKGNYSSISIFRAHSCGELFWGPRGHSETEVKPLSSVGVLFLKVGLDVEQHLYFILGQPVRVSRQKEGFREQGVSGKEGLVGRVPILPNNVLCEFAVLDIYLCFHICSVNTASTCSVNMVSTCPVILSWDAFPPQGCD